MSTLTSFSTAMIDERFRAKIGFDTNLLMYLLDNKYPRLNEFVLELGNYKAFVDLISNNYALFELYEKRKEFHFVKAAEEAGYGEQRLNSDKFSVNDTLRYESLLKLISLKGLLGNKFYTPLRKFCIRKWSSNILLGDRLFFDNQSVIMNRVKADIPRILDDFGIEIIGKLHDNLWMPTYELISHSRISREDSLIAISFLKPESLKNQSNLTLLTNDGDFQSFYTEADSRGLLKPLFNRLGMPFPQIERITNIKASYNSTAFYNLRSKILPSINIRDLAKEFIKRLIIQSNRKKFIGITDGKIFPKKPRAICIKISGEGEYHENQNLLIIGSELDFFYTIPYKINEFKDRAGNSLNFPLKHDTEKKMDHNRVVFFQTDLGADDPDKAYENNLVPALKRGGNLVFIHPDS
ncbi:MAG TPA: hypothetical protein VK622_04645 [Puia sp.]|nr:hypothetical protein [Puia sp.]